MKNILGKHEDLKLFNEKGKIVYKYYKDSDGCCLEFTYDEKGNVLTYKISNGYWYEKTRDKNGNLLTYKDSNGFLSEYTYDKKSNVLTYKNSDGGWYERTYDEKGNELTYKNSTGVKRGFDIPEYTMEELVNKLGNFKIKK